MRTIRLRVTLREVAPRVLRVVDVPASSTLPELHELLQVAVGWTDGHLHQFVAGDMISRLAAVLQGLDRVQVDWPGWSAGPSALTLLSRATALAQIWTTGRHKIPGR